MPYLHVQLRRMVCELAARERSLHDRQHPARVEEALAAPHERFGEPHDVRRARERCDARAEFVVGRDKVLDQA